MVSVNIKVDFGQASEVRPVAMLVQLASRYDSLIYIEKGNRSVNAKSIMGMMTMGFEPGEEIKLTCTGADEEQAAAAIGEYLTTGQ